MANYKQYLYTKGTALDGEFSAAPAFGKIRPGKHHLFWKSGLRWYGIPLTDLQRIYRRVEPVFGKLCCGGRSFIIEWLVLVLHLLYLLLLQHRGRGLPFRTWQY